MEEELLKGKTLLVVDDEADLRDIVASELEFMGAKVFQAENITLAQSILKSNKVDLIISDIRMPGGTGIDLLEFVKAQGIASPPMILITGFADITIEDAFNKGAEALVNKPFKLDDLIRMVVRYTSPFHERFSTQTKADKSIETHLDDERDVRFGRGGLSVPVDTHGKKFDIGDAVNFDFVVKGKEFRGQGVCRWVRPSESGKTLMGIEFMNLTDPSLDKFRELSYGKVPYIPSLNA